MADSTVENLTDIAVATPSGIQSTDNFYVFRPGTPDLDFKADGDDIQTLVLGGTLSVTAAGRALLDDADAAAQLTTLGIGNVENTALSTWAGTTNVTTLGTVTTGTWNGTAIGDSYISSAATWNAKQAGDATLTALAGVTTAANKLIYATGSDTFTTTDFTAAGRALVDDADASAQRTTLGLGTMATQSASAVAITGGTASGLTSLGVSGGQVDFSVTDTTDGISTYQEVGSPLYTALAWAPASDSGGVRFAHVGYTTHTTANSITGVGHYGGILGYGAKNNATGTDALVIGVEGRAGALLGNVTSAAAVLATFDTDTENAGTITIGIGFYLPPQSDHAHITSKFAFFNANTDWPIRTLGTIQMVQGSYAATVTRATLTADRTITLPDATGTVALTTATINDQSGTTYTLQASDTGKAVVCTNASAITVTLPNSLSTGFFCEVIQGGAGQVSFSVAGGGTLNNRSSHTKIAGQHGSVRLIVTANSGGSAAVYNLAGDTGT